MDDMNVRMNISHQIQECTNGELIRISPEQHQMFNYLDILSVFSEIIVNL